jgi:FdhD protein
MIDANSQISSVLRWDGQSLSRQNDELAPEEPLEIRVRGRSVSITMRTPGHDDELAAGFLLTEGIIRSPEAIVRIEPCARNEAGNLINVVLAPEIAVDFERLTRHVFASSSCGLCGKSTIDSIASQFPPIETDFALSAEILSQLPEKMRREQSAFDRTGGLHAAALFDANGKCLVLREDVGRHNAVDKVIGHCLLHDLFPPERCVLLVSGRSSFEIATKALSARIPIVAAISAPSSLAVDFAKNSGLTLIGFLRDKRMNVYAHPRRICFPSQVTHA